jgi:DUF1009 family protein
MDNNTLGVIAGGGAMPLMVVDSAKRAGQRVVVIGLREWADPVLAGNGRCLLTGPRVSRLGRQLRLLLREHAYRAILAGSVQEK